MNNRAENEKVEEITVYCTRPRVADRDRQNHPHRNQILETDILDKAKRMQLVCQQCGMSLGLGGNAKYIPIRYLGRGGFGVTFLAIDLNAPVSVTASSSFVQRYRRVVIKQLRDDHFGDEQDSRLRRLKQKKLELFYREATTLCKLKHSNIPTLFEYFDQHVPADQRDVNPAQAQSPDPTQQPVLLYLAQQYIKGIDLDSLLKQRKVFTEPETRRFLRKMLLILKDIHSGVYHEENTPVIHRDIKPANIVCSSQSVTEADNTGLITVNLETDDFYLIDFGAVKEVVQQAENEQTQPKTVVFSPGFTAPEQKTAGKVGPYSDLYSLGATCVNLLTGKNPEEYEHGNSRETSLLIGWIAETNISPEFAAILDKMLANQYQYRYQSAEAVLADLDVVPPPPPPPPSTNWLPFALGALGAGLLAGGIGIGIQTGMLQIPVSPDSVALLNPQDFSRGEDRLFEDTQYTAATCRSAFAAKAAGQAAIAEALKVGPQGDQYQNRLAEAQKQLTDALNQMAATRGSGGSAALGTSCPYDPETLIALSNVVAWRSGQLVDTLAAVVPLGETNQDLIDASKAILVGVSLEQAKANGINIQNNQVVIGDPPARPVEIVIARDRDNVDQAKQVAQALLQPNNGNFVSGDPSFQGTVLGVIGHSSSRTTDPAGQLYGAASLENLRMPLVSPTSTAIRNPAGPAFSDYVFRLSPSDAVAARDLADYAKNQVSGSGQPDADKVYVVSSANDPYGDSYKTAIEQEFGPLAEDYQCNLNQFDGSVCLKNGKPIPEDVKAIVLVPRPTEIDQALKVIKQNRNSSRPLPILGGDSLYRGGLVAVANEALVGVVVAIPWQAELLNRQSKYGRDLVNFLGTRSVDWRSGTAFDATLVLVEALKQQDTPTRAGTFEALNQLKQRSIQGITGPVQFCRSGDRRAFTGIGILTEIESGRTAADPLRYVIKQQPDRSSQRECP